jgi:hypothetical protein
MDKQDLKVVKTEVFSIDALENLTSHDGVSLDTKRLLKAYKRTRQDGNKVQVIYEYGKLLKTIQKGRLYPQKGMGLQNFPSDVRSALAQQYYWDIDMVNSQPVILLQMCKKNGWLCDELQSYVENRSQWLSSIMKELECDRDGAKQLCLATMFGGTYKRSPDFIKRLSAELCQVGVNLINANQELLKIVSKEKNPSASCVAHVLQDTEFQILRHIDSFFQQEGHFMDTYIHDGGLVRKLEGEMTFPAELLRRAELDVLRVFGYAISLEVKPLTHTFEFKRDVMRTQHTSEREYQQRKELFEENHFYCEQTSSICTVTPFGLTHTSKSDAFATFASFNFQKTHNQRVLIDRFISIWMDDPLKRVINKLVFYPDVSHQPEGCYNTFCGLQGAIETDMPSRAGAIIERFNELVFVNAGCRENDALYLKKWLAHGVQLPHKVPGVAIVLINESQGTGKETLMEFMGNKVFGKEYYKNIKNVETELFDTHSTAMDKTLFLKLEEVNGSLNRKFADMLKGIITATSATINPKGVGKYTIDAFPRVVMTTNNAVPVKVEKDDRRFCIFYTSSKYMGNSDFWNETYSLFDLPEAGHVIHQYLMSLNLSQFEVKLFPKTDYHQALAETEVASEKEFINQCDAFADEGATSLHTRYLAYCREQGYVPKGVVHFTRMLTPMVETAVLTRRALHGRSLYSKTL